MCCVPHTHTCVIKQSVARGLCVPPSLFHIYNCHIDQRAPRTHPSVHVGGGEAGAWHGLGGCRAVGLR